MLWVYVTMTWFRNRQAFVRSASPLEKLCVRYSQVRLILGSHWSTTKTTTINAKSCAMSGSSRKPRTGPPLADAGTGAGAGAGYHVDLPDGLTFSSSNNPRSRPASGPDAKLSRSGATASVSPAAGQLRRTHIRLDRKRSLPSPPRFHHRV